MKMKGYEIPLQHIKEFLYGTPLRRTCDGIYDGIYFI